MQQPRFNLHPTRFMVPGALCLLLFVFACSKGGGSAATGTPDVCKRLDEISMDGTPAQPPLPNALYAELRSHDGSTTLPVNLEGVGGSYSGSTAPFQKCQYQGTYYVERAVLTDINNARVATVQRNGGNYQVTYKNGTSLSVNGSTFTSYYTSFATPIQAAATLAQVGANTQTVKQGESVTLSAVVMPAPDACEIKDVQLWLTATPSGARVTPVGTIIGGSGASIVRVPGDITAGTYYVEGRINIKGGRHALIRRESTTDSTYRLNTPGISPSTVTTVPVVQVSVLNNPDADVKAPQALKLEASPASVPRCGQVTFTLSISDNRPLPPSQEVKLKLGPLGQMGLTTVVLKGAESLTGSFVVPMDAPRGVWFGYPESIVDSAGNVGLGRPTNDGKFTINGVGAQVLSATFIVVGEDPLPVSMDMASLPGADMAAMLPATLRDMSIMPMSILPEQAAVVSITWTDHSMSLR